MRYSSALGNKRGLRNSTPDAKNMAKIASFNDNERWVTETTLMGRFSDKREERYRTNFSRVHELYSTGNGNGKHDVADHEQSKQIFY